jgi:uncharacterized phage protein (TIGR01671 family)
MSRIKVRAWDNVKNKMYYLGEEENVVFTFDSNGIVATDITEDEEEFKTLHHLKYMQCTGYKDKHDNEIYEDDIVKRYEDNLWKMKDGSLKFCSWLVGLRYGGWNFVNTSISPATSYPSFYSNAQYMEVIGNVYENPEFLIERTKAIETTE